MLVMVSVVLVVLAVVVWVMTLWLRTRQVGRRSTIPFLTGRGATPFPMRGVAPTGLWSGLGGGGGGGSVSAVRAVRGGARVAETVTRARRGRAAWAVVVRCEW